MPVNPDHAIQPPAPVLLERVFALADEAATLAFGERFAKAIESVRAAISGSGNAFHGLQVQLVGDLGAGKTTLVRATLRGLGHTGRVRSPTYTLVDTYSAGALTFVHVDLYRVQTTTEVEELGLRDMTGPGNLMLIEWPEKGGFAVPRPDLLLQLTYKGEARSAALGAVTATGRIWLEKLAIDTSLAPYVSNLT